MRYGISAEPVGKFQWRALELTGICIIVFLLSQVFPDFFYSTFVLSRSTILSMPWTILTHMFMHANFLHLYGNMFALAVFGSLFEKQAGSRNFLIVFFAGGIIFRPRSVVFVLGAPMYVLAALFVWAGMDLAGVFYPDSVAHFSHLAGIAFGVVYGLWLRRLYPELKKEKEKPALSDKEIEEWEKKYMGK
jgi:membrane associated rhomboid family serine protease